MIGKMVDDLCLGKPDSLIDGEYTWFWVEDIANSPNGCPVEIPIVIILVSFVPSPFIEVIDYNFLVEVALPLHFFWIHSQL